jgi:hypothetical protein
MFCIFHGNVLIGRSKLECGDPPMGVAFGRFEPTDAFAALRAEMTSARDGSGKEQRDMRFLSGLCAKTVGGTVIVCSHVEVIEYGEVDDPLGWEVSCLGIEYPLYNELFPHHVKAYEDLFKD